MRVDQFANLHRNMRSVPRSILRYVIILKSALQIARGTRGTILSELGRPRSLVVNTPKKLYKSFRWPDGHRLRKLSLVSSFSLFFFFFTSLSRSIFLFREKYESDFDLQYIIRVLLFKNNIYIIFIFMWNIFYNKIYTQMEISLFKTKNVIKVKKIFLYHVRNSKLLETWNTYVPARWSLPSISLFPSFSLTLFGKRLITINIRKKGKDAGLERDRAMQGF